MSRLKVVVDTNVLLLPFTDGTPLVEELERLLGVVEIVVPASVAGELEGLGGNGGKIGQAARAATRWSQRFERAETTLPGDDGILQVARSLSATVCTNDAKLQAEAKRSGLDVVGSLRDGRLRVVR